MIVVFDTTVLVFVVDEQAKAPIDPETSEPVTACQARVNNLIATLQRERATIIIPTPTLAEMLVSAGPAIAEWHTTLRRTKYVKIAPFDERAAVEHALREADRKAVRAAGVARAKAKFDDQIIAIAQTENAEVIYSDDPHIRNRAPKGVKVIGIAELELPPEEKQGELQLEISEPAKPEPAEITTEVAEVRLPEKKSDPAVAPPPAAMPEQNVDAAPEPEQEDTAVTPEAASQPSPTDAEVDGAGEAKSERRSAPEPKEKQPEVVKPQPVEPAEERPVGT